MDMQFVDENSLTHTSKLMDRPSQRWLNTLKVIWEPLGSIQIWYMIEQNSAIKTDTSEGEEEEGTIQLRLLKDLTNQTAGNNYLISAKH